MDSDIRIPGQGFEPLSASREPAVQIDPAASAALAQAIRSAKQGPKPAGPASRQAETARPAVPSLPRHRFMIQGALGLVLIGAGSLASYMGTLANRDAIQRLETETARSQEILARLSEDLDSLKGTLAAYKDVEQTSSVTSASSQSKLADKVERLAVAIKDPGQKLTALETRLDRMENQILTNIASLAAKPPAPAPTPAPAAVEAAVRNDAPAAKSARDEPLEGWTLREVYDGAALVEGKNRRLYEVMPGGVIPGAGRVEAIERRGRNWVVLTDKGFIGSSR
jgi:hypothetical protein